MNINLMKNEVIPKKPSIQIGDVLLCADGHDLSYILVVSEGGGILKAVNLNYCFVETSAKTLEQLYENIERKYDIKNIVNEENVTLNVQIDE